MFSPKTFFLHNPKAGGTALRNVLAQLSDGSHSPVFWNAPNEQRDNPDRLWDYAGYDHYAGHYGYEVYAKLASGHALITNFRDPIQRIRSMYRYWRHNVPYSYLDNANPLDAQIVVLAKDRSFSDFIRTDSHDLLLYISNFHFRQLYQSGWKRCRMGASSEWLVKKRIRRMPWFYIAEASEASIFLLQNFVGKTRSIDIRRENESLGDIAETSPDDAAYLTKLNLMDYSIYSYASKIQCARIAKLKLDMDS
ncbi:sulfotransferase family 2 domain-containing protein [Sphingobium algorifonticola]|uniref:Sulfotransferase family protein n=1 Tax=Sphingobium algorifonticola TaxID=2008318 RepID=A0A437J704_9SPHN|nr:sulfotransferase family 2 domain-containing protein [Sphingobium algorifonticola]RVT40952.1 hypothetical protein ENE74_10870 [Sphingobium algorifonticola]